MHKLEYILENETYKIIKPTVRVNKKRNTSTSVFIRFNEPLSENKRKRKINKYLDLARDENVVEHGNDGDMNWGWYPWNDP